MFRNVLNGFSFRGTEAAAIALSHSPNVAKVERDRGMRATAELGPNGIFRIEVFGSQAHLWLGTWRGEPADVDRFKEPWRQMLDRLFLKKTPQPAAQPADRRQRGGWPS